MITFAIEELQYEGTLLIMNDEVVENVKQLNLRIEARDGVFPVNVVDATATVTITDDDGKITCYMQYFNRAEQMNSIIL